MHCCRCNNSTRCAYKLRKVCTDLEPCCTDAQMGIMLPSSYLLDLPLSVAGQGVIVAPEGACLPSTLFPASWSGSMPVSLSLNVGWCMQHICVSSHGDSSYQHVTGVDAHLCTMAGYKVEHSLTAHSGGLEALDARGNFVATCGYGTRLGQVALDNMVKVLCSPLVAHPLPASLGAFPAPLGGNTLHQSLFSLLCCTKYMWGFQ